MKTNENLKRLNKAELIAWIIFIGLGINYMILTFLLA